MTGESDGAALEIALEERAHRLRVAMLRDREFVAGIRRGHEAAESGELVSLAELDRLIVEWDREDAG